MRRLHLVPAVAWTFTAGITLGTVWEAVQAAQDPSLSTTELLTGLSWLLVPVTFAVLGAFVVTRRPDNTIGWLLLVPGLAVLDVASSVVSSPTAPDHVSWGTLAVLWYDAASWIFLILPIFLVLALFPTGRSLSPRWRWHTWLVVVLGTAMVVLAVFSTRAGPTDASWTVANPIGFIPDVGNLTWFFPLWDVLLIVATIGGAAAMVVRFRRSGWAERQQIKMLLYAVTVFAVIYSVGAVNEGWADNSPFSALLSLGMLLIPVAMAVAILRHRVFDIDLVIRRTILYALVTGVLGGVYVGSVVLFQSVAGGMLGLDSSIAVAASTLLIAALFRPVRARTQAVLARRFFRGRYDRAQTLAAFAGHARDELDSGRLGAALLTAVDDTLHPATLSLWVPTPERPPAR